LVREFNKKQNKVYVSTRLVYGDYEGIINEELMKSDLPDIFQGGYSYTSYIINNSPIVPVQEFIDEDNLDLSDFNASMLEFGKGSDGRLYGMPFAVSTPIIYYNKDLFEKVGLDPNKPPTTFEEVRQYAKQLTSGETQGVYFNYSISGNWLLQALIEGHGGTISDQGEFKFQEPEGERSLQYLVDLIHEDHSMGNITEEEAYNRFVYGKIGMFISTSASIKSIAETGKFELGTATFPTDGENPRKVPGGGNSLFIMKTTPEKEKAAWEFIKYATSAEGSSFFAKNTGYMTTSKSALEQEDLMGEFLKENEPFRTVYEQSNDMVNWYNPPIELGTKFYTILQKHVIYALTAVKSPNEALKNAYMEMK
jgi:multiple sugar transport system substrate-binding protein